MIELLKSDAFDEVFEIMKKSFPKDEYRTYEGQKKLLEEPVYRIYGMRDFESGNIHALFPLTKDKVPYGVRNLKAHIIFSK